jgi:hypothetical protein
LVELTAQKVTPFSETDFRIAIGVDSSDDSVDLFFRKVVAKLAEEVNQNFSCDFTFFVPVDRSKRRVRREVWASLEVSDQGFDSEN